MHKILKPVSCTAITTQHNLWRSKSWLRTAGLCGSSTSKSKTELPISKPMILLRSDSSFVQSAAWPFNRHALCSSDDNLHETDAANWTTSRLYNARMIHWKAATTTTQPTHHTVMHMQTRYNNHTTNTSRCYAYANQLQHCRNGNFRPFWLLWPWPWPWPEHLHIWTRPVVRGDIPHVQKWTSYVKAFESYRLTDMQADIHTDRQTYTETTKIISHATSWVVTSQYISAVP